jgi:hypothetical protein
MSEINSTTKSLFDKAGKASVSSADTTPSTLGDKIVGGGSYVGVSTLNPSGDAQLNVQKTSSPTDTLVKVTVDDNTAAVLQSKIQLANSTSGIQIAAGVSSLSFSGYTDTLPSKFPAYSAESIAWDLRTAKGATTQNPTYGGS